MNKLDFGKINAELVGTLEGANRVTNGPEIRASLRELELALSTFRSMAQNLDRRVEPIADNLDKTLTAGRTALRKAQGTLRLVDDVLKSDSPLQSSYIELADELTETARSIKTLVDMLARNPEAFIFGK